MSVSHGGRPFEVYDLNDNYIKTFDTQHECSRELNMKQSNIWSCLKGKTKSLKGFKFKYVGEDFKHAKSEYSHINSKIEVYNKNGILIGTYLSIKEIVLELKISYGTVRRNKNKKYTFIKKDL